MNSILPNGAPLQAALAAVSHMPSGIGEALLMLAALALSAAVIRADMRDLEIDARLVVALALCGVALGLVAPIAPLTASGVAFGTAVGLGLGGIARAYAWARTGLPAFGGADILLLGGIGGSLGASWLGAVTALAAVIAMALARAGLPGLAERAYPNHPAQGVGSGTLTDAVCAPGSIPPETPPKTPPGSGGPVRVLPFCPALIVAWIIVWGLVRTGSV